MRTSFRSALVTLFILVESIVGSAAAHSASHAHSVVRRSTARVVRVESHSSHGVVQSESSNWAGWAVTSRRAILAVRGSWRVPAADCGRREDSVASNWIGIDGLQQQSTTVEQIGTDTGCHNGDPWVAPWVEMFPDPPVFFTKKLPVRAGDRVTGVVYRNGRFWTLRLTDNTTGSKRAFSAICSFSECLSSSAEAITERPGRNPQPLSDFGRTLFTSAAAATDQDAAYFGDSYWRQAWNITMTNRDDDALVTTSNLDRRGDFYTEWEAAT
jgi:hypothetical protein